MIDWTDLEQEEEAADPPSCASGGKLRVQREQCDTCIFRPGNKMHLRSSRLKNMVQSVMASDSYVVCHKTLSNPLGAVCRGSYDNCYTHPIKFAERLNAIEWVQEP